MRVLVAVDVPDGCTTSDVAMVVDGALPREWDEGTGATVWTPEELGVTLIDRQVADETDGALIDAVNEAAEVAFGNVTLGDGCEWCSGQSIPGVVVPPKRGPDGEYAVERCDACGRYPNDAAAKVAWKATQHE